MNGPAMEVTVSYAPANNIVSYPTQHPFDDDPVTLQVDLSTLYPSTPGGGPNGSSSGGNATEPSARPMPYAIWQVVFLLLACSIIVVGTVLGNILVCTAVAIVRKLRTPSNLLIVSLAVSDLLVALLVMPFAALYEVKGGWILGHTFCSAWTSMDVLLCTASILNLCMISVDRYFVITRPFQYAMKRTPKRMALMIAAVWLLSAVISIPPLFGWKAKPIEGSCSVSQDIGYQFYATIGAFYLPLAVMIVIYYRIYMVSSRIAQAEAKSKPHGDGHYAYPHSSGASTPLRKDSCPEENHNVNFPNGSAGRRSRAGSAAEVKLNKSSDNHRDEGRFRFFKKSRLNGITSSKERKATKTLGVIMGAFTACWLPFFILALIKPFCTSDDGTDCIPHWLSSLFLWLGYANSFLNPIIYARFNRDFRTPFKEILMCHCRNINLRLRSESYAEQFGPRPGNLRDCIRPPVDTVVRYHSQGQTIVKLGNGQAAVSAAATQSTVVEEAKV